LNLSYGLIIRVDLREIKMKKVDSFPYEVYI
jgi:hypothetical protein